MSVVGATLPVFLFTRSLWKSNLADYFRHHIGNQSYLDSLQHSEEIKT